MAEMSREELLRAEAAGNEQGWVAPLTQEDKEYFAYLGSAEKASQTEKEKRFWKKSASQRASLWQAFMARMMRAASVFAVSSSLENNRSRPKRRLAFPLRPSMALRWQES